MRKEVFFDWLAVAVTGVAHVVVGVPVLILGRVHGELWRDMGAAQLPALSRTMFQYASTPLPLVVGTVLAVCSVLGLGYVVFSGRGRRFLAILVAASLVGSLLQVLVAWLGMSLPLFNVMYSMQN